MTHSEVRVIEAGGRRLEFHLRRSPRRRTLEISVEPDRQITVIAPSGTPPERIDAAVRRRSGWIRRQLNTLDALPQPSAPRRWESGETHRYLGRQYRLKVVQLSRPNVRLSGAFFIVGVPKPQDKRSIQRVMERWYKLHAFEVLASRLTHALESSTWLASLEPPTVSIRSMKQRWGSTTGGKRICFNKDLIKLPIGCIDYVVTHELVHLKYPHHGPAYWRLLSRCMPDWERWRERLAKQEL